MWDIKSTWKLRIWEDPDKYYLNHVGYKVVRSSIKLKDVEKYYLNHVGYKDFEAGLGHCFSPSYYLNHVGYKVATDISNGIKKLSII